MTKLTPAVFRVFVDWDNNGDYTGTYDEITDDVKSLRWSLGMRQPYQDVADGGMLDLVVNNTDGKYTPENTNSVLYGNLLPWRRIQVRANDTVMWTGFIQIPRTTWQPGPFSAGYEAHLRGVDRKALLDRVDVNLELYANVTGDVVIADVIPASEISTSSGVWLLGIVGRSEIGTTTTLGSTDIISDLETGITVFDTYGDTQAQSAFDVVKEITAGERGRFFFDRSGVAVWWNRHHFLLDITTDATVITEYGDYAPAELTYDYGDLIANVVKAEIHPRQTDGGSSTLWELDSSLSVAAGDTITIEALLRKSDGRDAATSSVTPSTTFSSGAATVTATSNGNKATVTLDNSLGIIPAVVSSLSLSGTAVIQQNDLNYEIEDATSVTAYGRQGLTINLGAVADYTTAVNVATYELSRRKDARGVIKTLSYNKAANGYDNSFILDWTIGTRLKIIATELYHNTDYFIIGESHDWRPGTAHHVTYYLEPADSNTFWILGESGFSELGQTTRIAY